MNRTVWVIIFFLTGLCMPGISLSVELADIQIHGFVGQGYLKSSDNNYLGNTENGSFDFSEIGINFAVPLTDNLRFGAQLFSQNLGDLGDNKVIFDWAFLDYSWRDWLGFRAGRIKMPFGLYNRQRDVDMLRTFVLLPQSVYSETLRNFVVAFNGFDIYGTWSLGEIGYLDYELFTGTIDISDGVQSLINAYNRSVLGIDDLWELLGLDITQAALSFRHIYGGMLSWNTPLPGFRIGGSIILGDLDLSIPFTENTDAPFTVDLINNGITVLSAEYEIGNLTVAAEYFKLDMDMESQGVLINTLLMGGWYTSASWNVIDWLSLGAYYMDYYPNLNDKDGKELEAAGLPAYYAWQKEIVASAKFNINEYWCVKFETHFINGVGLVPPANNPGTMEEDWILYAIKTSLNF